MISVASGDVVYPIDPEQNSASICVIFFQDLNGNRIQDNGEAVLPGGDLLLTSGGAPVSEHQTDTKPDPYCFSGLGAGSYSVQGVAPEGYGLTTPDELHVQAYSGGQVNVAFGAAEGVATLVPPTADGSAEAANGGIVDTANGSESDTNSTANALGDNIGLIVFGVAGVILVAGLGVSLLLRRR